MFQEAEAANGAAPRIIMQDEFEIRRWCRQAGCTEIELRAALEESPAPAFFFRAQEQV